MFLYVFISFSRKKVIPQNGDRFLELGPNDLMNICNYWFLSFTFTDTTNDLNESRDTNKSDTFDKSSIIMTEDDDKKVFYLFTKTAREKEEWFNHFMVAAKFMEDWEHQNLKEGLLKNYVYIRTSISAVVCLHC